MRTNAGQACGAVTTAEPPGASASPPVPVVTSRGEVGAPGRPARLLLVVLSLGWSATASAQGITMAPWQGELEATIEYDRETSRTSGFPEERFENTVAQEI
jgi:hypothetical protein